MIRIALTLLVVALVVSLEAGCETEGQKKRRAKSQVEVLGRKWDGGEKTPWDSQKDGTTGETDPWGKPVTWEFTATSLYRTLEVRSSGPDGLPFTDDDIVKRDRRYVGPPSKPLSERVEKMSEAISRGFSRGAVGGAKQGSRE